MSLKIRDVYESIATLLSVPGLLVCDADEIPTTDQARRQPVLYPEPGRILVNVTSQDDSFGPAAQRRMTATYTLVYTLLYKEAGLGRDLSDRLPDMLALIGQILDAFLALDTLGVAGVVDWNMTMAQAGYIQDAAGVVFEGATFQITLREYIN